MQDVSADFVGVVLHIMQSTTAVASNWFFIHPYNIEVLSKSRVDKWFSVEPHLFGEQFDHARFLAVPFCIGSHWILAIADIQKMEIMMFNSLHDSTNLLYQKRVWHNASMVEILPKLEICQRRMDGSTLCLGESSKANKHL